MKYYVVSHAHCYDGMAAHWVASRNFRNKFPGISDVEYISHTHGNPFPEFKKDSVIIFLDCAPKKDAFIQYQQNMAAVYVLDHHATAMELAGMQNVTLDRNRSGAQLAAEFFRETNNYVLRIVDYVADRDLWKHVMPQSDDVNNFIRSLPNVYSLKNMAKWNELIISSISVNAMINDMAERGKYLSAYRSRLIDSICTRSFKIIFEGRQVNCVNVDPEFTSEVLHKLVSTEYPMALGYYRAGNVYNYSLRSIPSFDVSEIARNKGGGGHKNAAGFTLDGPPEKLVELTTAS